MNATTTTIEQANKTKHRANIIPTDETRRILQATLYMIIGLQIKILAALLSRRLHRVLESWWRLFRGWWKRRYALAFRCIHDIRHFHIFLLDFFSWSSRPWREDWAQDWEHEERSNENWLAPWYRASHGVEGFSFFFLGLTTWFIWLQACGGSLVFDGFVERRLRWCYAQIADTLPGWYSLHLTTISVGNLDSGGSTLDSFMGWGRWRCPGTEVEIVGGPAQEWAMCTTYQLLVHGDDVSGQYLETPVASYIVNDAMPMKPPKWRHRGLLWWLFFPTHSFTRITNKALFPTLNKNIPDEFARAGHSWQFKYRREPVWEDAS